MTVGIYIQIPFCRTKCTYCNFHTGILSRGKDQPYVRAVCREIRRSSGGAPESAAGAQAATAEGPQGLLGPGPAQAVDTIYLGGGTPSLLDGAALDGLIGAVRARFQVLPAAEVTLEADPETVTGEKAAGWLSSGFNRISLGVQSFNDRELKSAGRMHRREDIARSTDVLREAGFSNISMDLIAGLPHQTRAAWDLSVAELLALRPEHVSIYLLEIDEGSRLGQESLAGGTRYSAGAIPPDDAMADFYECACERLARAGYQHYEISNWALPGMHSRHNLKYWRREPYLGFGAGAHSFHSGVRWSNVHDPGRYVTCLDQAISPRETSEEVTLEQALDEEFFLGLRQLEGIELDRIESAYRGNGLGDRLRSRRARIADLQQQGLVEFDGRRLRLAASRLTVSNEVFVALLE
ncbi:MAG TPA: radical SAM family heme chaperone HemW [Candidatus Cybelea sp.]|nr:radical SAM family heme chaperone HemW [Candidatus Cybelea sp.]